MKRKFLGVLACFVVLSSAVEAKSQSDVVYNSESSDNRAVTVANEKCGNRNYAVGTMTIDAPPEAVWSVLVDYDHAPEVFPNLKLCKQVGQKGNEKLIRQLVETAGFVRFDYVVALEEQKPRLIVWHHESGSLKEVTGSWQLEPSNGGKQTKVTYRIYMDGGFFLRPGS